MREHLASARLMDSDREAIRSAREPALPPWVIAKLRSDPKIQAIVALHSSSYGAGEAETVSRLSESLEMESASGGAPSEDMAE